MNYVYVMLRADDQPGDHVGHKVSPCLLSTYISIYLYRLVARLFIKCLWKKEASRPVREAGFEVVSDGQQAETIVSKLIDLGSG